MKTIYEVPTEVGSNLSAECQRFAKSAFVHRFTRNHRPQWSFDPRPDGTPYPVQFASDDDWLAHTWFAVDEGGRINHGFPECMSRPTWPDNPELQKDKAIMSPNLSPIGKR